MHFEVDANSIRGYVPGEPVVNEVQDTERFSRGQFPHVHFVVSESLATLVNSISYGEQFSYWKDLTLTTEAAWLGRSFLILREFGWSVSCSATFEQGAINAISADRIDARIVPLPVFTVVFQSDLRWFAHGDAFIVQNPTQHSARRRRFYIPHWPPPVVIPRDRSRTNVTRVGLMGIPWIRALSTSSFRCIFAHLGLDVIDLWKERRWHNYSDIDVLIAIRSFDRRTHDTKPPWKLFTAWLARCPLVAGNDSAFSYEGDPNRDYIRVTTIEEMCSAITRLRDDSEYYRQIVEAGCEKSKDISIVRIESRWAQVFVSHIFPVYENYFHLTHAWARNTRRARIVLQQWIRHGARSFRRLVNKRK